MDRPPARRTRLATASVLLALSAGLAACSSSPGSTATGGTATTSAAGPTACHRALPARPVVATPVAGSTTDWNVTSFDGTQIRAHWFPLARYVPGTAAGPHPTVFMGPGWSLPGDTDPTAPGILGQISIHDLLAAGYNVLTWDPRGFGQSGGSAEVDSAAYEARDVSRLIDWVATLPGVQLDAPGDPRMGMVGGSYGGGIQLVTAATDCRVDAIVPTIAWHSLVTSLDKTGLVKIGWSNILTNLASTDHVAPEVTAAAAAGRSGGTIPPADLAWFAARGPGALVGHIHVPTLIVQGTVDTLFTLQEGVDNYRALRAAGTTVAMQWFCGGHGVCLTPPGDTLAPERATLAWLRRWVQRDRSVATGPGFTFVDQNGTTYTAPAWPVAPGRPLTASGAGTLDLVATGGSGPLAASPAGQTLGSLVAPITPTPASTAVTIPVTTGRSAVVVGAPSLSLTYRGTVAAGVRPTRVFAQLVDASTGLVVGNQVTPVAVTLNGARHTTTVPLEMVAYTATPSSRLELQLVATTVAYATPRLGGSVTFSSVHLSLPTAGALTPQAG